VFRNAREVVPELRSEPAAARAFLIANAAARAFWTMRRLALYPRLIEAAAVAHEPHRIPFYL
jgi:arginyl-tRNA synthetase